MAHQAEIYLPVEEAHRVAHVVAVEWTYQRYEPRLGSYDVHQIVNHFTELTELNADIMFNRNWEIEDLVKNMSPKVKKLSLQAASHLEDEHLRVLVSRCNQLKELVVAGTSITDESVSIIVQNLTVTLEKLDVCYTKISFDKICEFRAMPNLKFLNCSYGRTMPRFFDEQKNLKKWLPEIGINLGDFHIAKTWKSFSCEIKRNEKTTPSLGSQHDYEYINKNNEVRYLNYLW